MVRAPRACIIWYLCDSAVRAETSRAVAISFIPAVAALVLIEGGTLLAGVGRSAGDLAGTGRLAWESLLVLGNGFIVSALLCDLWVTPACLNLFDRRRAAPS